MKYLLLVLLNLIFLFACESNDEQKVEEKKEKKTFDMYERSEMAATMLYMFEFNKQLKAKIEDGDTISGDFPEAFNQILEASMTEGHVHDQFFEEHAASFLEYQKALHNSPDNQKETFNAMVNACISCHEAKCTGPIPKIKKLYISEE